MSLAIRTELLKLLSPAKATAKAIPNKDDVMKLVIVEAITAFTGVSMMLIATLPMMSEERLQIFCAVGGILGASIYVLFYTPPTHRQAMFVFLGNSIAAAAFGPWICDSLTGGSFTINMHNAIGISASIGLSATFLIREVLPALAAKVLAFVCSLSIAAVVARLFGFKMDDLKEPKE